MIKLVHLSKNLYFMSKLLKISHIFLIFQTFFLIYIAIFNVFNVSAASLQRLEPSRFLQSSDIQFKNLCCSIDQIDVDSILNNTRSVKKFSIENTINTPCNELFSDIIRIQNYDCIQNKCFDENVSNKFISEISRIFLEGIDSFFYNIKEILYKFGNLNNADCQNEIKKMIENEIYTIHTNVANLENFIIDKNKHYTDSNKDYISKFHDRPTRVVDLNEISMQALNTLVFSLQNIFIHAVCNSIDLFPKNNFNKIRDNTYIEKKYNFMHSAYPKMTTNMYNYTKTPNESLIKQINIIYTIERHDKEESEKQSKESEKKSKERKKTILQLMRDPFNIDLGQSINPDLFSYWS